MEMALLKICAVMIVAVAMDMVLAHALELPGKLQLSKEQYLAVQAIYYPGFTFGGITEPLGVIVTALLVWLPAARRRRGFLCVQLRKAGSVRTNGLDLSERSLGILPPARAGLAVAAFVLLVTAVVLG
jgi:hypothetical protein